MPAEMTLEAFETQLSVFKKDDLQKKMDIASNVYKQGQLSLRKDKTSSPLSKCQQLTGVPIETLTDIQSLENKSIKFETWSQEQKQIIQRYSYEYTCVRKLLITYYTKYLEVPIRIKEDKKYEGYKKFFTLIQLPGTKASIIVEKPETLMDRHRFLYSKMMYREQRKNIVYIGKINVILNHGKFSYKEDNVEAKTRFIVAASPTFGHMGYIYSCGHERDYLANWIQEKIISQLSEESVIIFQENVLTDDGSIVTDMSKEEIINWLKSNEVHHDSTMHRAELYKLVKKFQQNHVEQLSTIELSFRAKGHITLRKKSCNLNNNYFDPFWDFLIHELNAARVIPTVKSNTKLSNLTHAITNSANIIVQNVPLKYWNDLGNILLEKEKDIYREDMEMEHIIDKLMTMVKNEGLPKEWETSKKLDEYDETENQNYIILSDKLVKFYENMRTKQLYKSLNIFK